MKNLDVTAGWRGVAVAGLVALGGTLAAAPNYRLLTEIPIAGEGGWDYLTVDAPNHRLYLSHATKMVAIDTATDQLTGEIADTPGVHGIALAPALGRGFTSNGRENKVGVIDLATLKTLTKVPTGENPDAILFEPGRREVYAFNGRSHSVTVIAAETAKVVATTPLSGKPEFAESEGGRVYVNIEDRNEIAVLDAATHAVAAQWPIAPGEEATGLALDAAHHRLFAGCANAKVVVVDAVNGGVVAVVPAGEGIDAVAFDPATQLVFASNGGDGTVTIAHEDAPDKFTVVQTLATAPGARTMTIDPATHKIYLPAAKYAPAEPGKRPRIVAGSLKVLVFGPGS